MLPFHQKTYLERPLEWIATPSPRLQPYVAGYSGVIIPSSEPLNFGHRSYPSGNVFLQFVFGRGKTFETQHAYKLSGEDKMRPSQSIILPRPVSWRAKLEESPDFVLVKLKAGMAAPFLNLSLSELGTWESVNDIWPSIINEQFSEIEFVSIQDRIQIIERVLLQCLEQSTVSVDQTVQDAIKLIQQGRGGIEMQSLADQLHISGRQLRRKFQHHVGLAPKQYNNIVRFQNANYLLKNQLEMTLTEVAHHSGYFDLAHFTHAIQEIAGISPTEMSRIDQQELQVNDREIDTVSCHASLIA